MNISKEAWEEIAKVLGKYNIQYTSHYESRDVPKAMEYSDRTLQDKYIQIDLVVLDYFNET